MNNDDELKREYQLVILSSMSQVKNAFKDTLNLPKTAFPMKANLGQNEPQRLKNGTSSSFMIGCKKKQMMRLHSPSMMARHMPMVQFILATY